MRLSLCIATYNEEEFIHYPLDSAYDLVDEVIIVDGGSSDKTVEIAKSYGKKVKIVPAKNVPMFHINKQKALDAASGDWILQLDADEALSPELKKEVIGIVEAARIDKRRTSDGTSRDTVNDTVAYWIPRKNFFLGRFLMKGGVYPDHTIRLYKNGEAHFPCKDVHENVEVTPPESSRANSRDLIGYLQSPIMHYADPTFSRYIKRWHRYNKLDAEKLRQELTTRNSQLVTGINFIFIKPIKTFINMFFLHGGFLDGWQGFVFAFFSSIRFIAIYLQSLRAR